MGGSATIAIEQGELGSAGRGTEPGDEVRRVGGGLGLGSRAWTEGEERLGPGTEVLGLKIREHTEVRFKALEFARISGPGGDGLRVGIGGLGSEEVGKPGRAGGVETRGLVLEDPKAEEVRLQLEVFMERGHFC
ncbi:hypothetical protein MRB53_033611 [Persea americana]|uniref:Uncharacterized protein n=1 Tax=Persea americana TaxID=3435 RepID=A0ACC2KV99_PERAE|nr:hypothetical protein MRB53_033611 [Persea americana]